MQQLYQAVLEECGASVVFDESLSSSQETEVSLPAVTPVPLLEEPALLSSTTAVVFTEEELAFEPDSTQFADAGQAQEALAPVAGYLAEDTARRILLAGTTATAGTQEECVRFSAARAQAVKEYLVFTGASSEQIEILGLGYENKFHIPDTNPDGTLNEKRACKPERPGSSIGFPSGCRAARGSSPLL